MTDKQIEDKKLEELTEDELSKVFEDVFGDSETKQVDNDPETPDEDPEKDETSPDANHDTDTDPEPGEPVEDGESPETSEPAPITDRLKEFEQLVEQPTSKSLRDELKDFEHQLVRQQQELQQDFLADLPKMTDDQGRSIYSLNSQQVNDYIVKLQDDGKAFIAGQVQINYSKAVDKAQAYQQHLQEFNTSKTKLQDATDYVDWQEIKSEVTTKLPEVTQEDFTKIGQYIDSKSVDPVYKAALSSKAGKLQKGVEAMKDLGILQRLKDVSPKDETKLPSAPDSRSPSKKVKAKPSGELVTRLEKAKSSKQESFNNLSDSDIDELLKASFSLPKR